MALKTRKIDPATGSYVVEAGRYVMVDECIGNAHALITTDAGSVPDAPQFACKLRSVSRENYPGMTRAVESTIGKTLEPYDGTLWGKHTVSAWLNAIDRLEYEASVDGEVV
jgi:hypothetical protein